MKTAIFGGTFNPIHAAHLAMARLAADRLGIDRVLFIPAGRPPHKEAATPYEDRYRMVELACAADPRFQPSRLEEGNEKSYSIHTIERAKAMERAEAKDAGPLYFIIGSDAFEEIKSWYRWQDVIAAVEFIVVARPGHSIDPPPGATVHRLDDVALPVSSSQIRRALARGEVSPELPGEVADYIRTHRLYRD
jgi:nicotinate-nucleotide adenylyltransferase